MIGEIWRGWRKLAEGEINIRVNTKGLENKLREALKEFEGFGQEVMREMGEVGSNQIKINSPKKTGNYSDTWDVTEITDSKVVVSNPNEDLAKYLEFGTKPHIITPKNKTVLHWIADDGSEHFATIVHHNGFPAIPHVRPAREVMRVMFPMIVLKHMRNVGIKMRKKLMVLKF
jgi:hypothetical protein